MLYAILKTGEEAHLIDPTGAEPATEIRYVGPVLMPVPDQETYNRLLANPERWQAPGPGGGDAIEPQATA